MQYAAWSSRHLKCSATLRWEVEKAVQMDAKETWLEARQTLEILEAILHAFAIGKEAARNSLCQIVS